MIYIKKQIVLSVMIVTVAGAGIFGVSSAYAQGVEERDTLIQKISNTFSLNKADVQKVFDQHRSEHMANRQAKVEEQLSTLVSEGKITEAQKTLMLNKHKELQDEMKNHKDTLKDMTPEERKAAVQKHRQELEEWAKQNNVDLQYLMPMKHMGKRIK